MEKKSKQCIQETDQKAQTTTNQISIDGYLDGLQKEWENTNARNKRYNPPIPLTYEQFCKLVIAHGSNFMAKRRETDPFTIDRNNENAIHEIFKYLKHDRSFNGSLSKGILINGKYGAGKTVLMNAVCATYNYCVEIWNDYQIAKMRMVKSSGIVDSFRKEKNEIEINNYKSGLLIIDELGREQKEVNVYGTIIHPVSYVIQERYDRGSPTFAVANFTIETLSNPEHYGKMIGDRLRQMFNELKLPGESRRS